MSAAEPPIERLPTFVEGLDRHMEGGIPKGTVIVIQGGAGCMKSTLAYSILHFNALRGNRAGLYITIEQPASEIEAQMVHMGLSRRSAPGLAERVNFLDLGHVRSVLAELGENEEEADWFASILGQIKSHKEKQPIDFVVLDSLNGIFALQRDSETRLALFHFITELKALGLTSLLIHEVPTSVAAGEGVAGFLADGIISVERQRRDESVALLLSVTKMRKTAHDHTYFPFLIRQGRLEVVIR